MEFTCILLIELWLTQIYGTYYFTIPIINAKKSLYGQNINSHLKGIVKFHNSSPQSVQ